MARILVATGVFFGWVLAKPIGRIKIPIARRMADGAELYRHCGFELVREAFPKIACRSPLCKKTPTGGFL